VEKVERPTFIVPSYGEIIELNSKYRTLETLIEMGVEFCELINEDQETIVVAYKFGHKDHKDYLHELKMEAASTNAAIERQEKCNAAAWARENWSRPLARKRANAWKKFLSFNSTALCLDFAHAMTIHKSQGSTYNTVFVDTDDVYRAADFSTQQYLKLMYVALSRASNQVITN
jgi:exodeoxyribonuclease-5